MMLEPPENLAASYTLVPPIDIEKFMAVSEWSKESSFGFRKPVRLSYITKMNLYTSIPIIPPACTWERAEVCRPPMSAPLMELERDRVGVDEAGGSTIERVIVFRS